MTVKTVHAAGRDIAIGPIKVRHLPAFLAALGPLATALLAQKPEGARGGADLWPSLLENHSQRLIDATALGADVELDWLREQDAEVLLELAAAVVEVNVDFFVQRLVPRVIAASEALDSATQGMAAHGGSIGSRGLSAQGSTTGL